MSDYQKMLNLRVELKNGSVGVYKYERTYRLTTKRMYEQFQAFESEETFDSGSIKYKKEVNIVTEVETSIENNDLCLSVKCFSTHLFKILMKK